MSRRNIHEQRGFFTVVADRQRSLKIEVPAPQDDKLRFGRVGVIALVGFLIGIAWPRLAGVKLVPSVPTDENTPSLASSAEPVASAPAAAAVASAAVPETELGPPPAVEPGDRIKLSEAQIVSCRDAKGNKVDACGALDFDRVARTRLQALAACPGAPSGGGTLSLGFELDFRSNKIGKIERGKSTTLDDAGAKALLQCAEQEFASASLSDLKHDHERYTVFYRVEFLSQAAAAEAQVEGGDAGAEATSASGRATVTWELAILRSLPKDGDIVARILRGTRVVVTGRQGDWYKVRYDAKGNEAWVFRSAIGL